MITRSKTMADLNTIQALLEQVKIDLSGKASTAQLEQVLEKLKEKDERIEKLEAIVESQATMLKLMDRILWETSKSANNRNTNA